MAKRGLDMAKFTNRQRRHAADLEAENKKAGMPPREAEAKAWEEAGASRGGKRKSAHSYAGRAKINSSASPKNRKPHSGPAEATTRSRAGRGQGKAKASEKKS